MPLNITLKVAKNEILFQEDLRCELTYTNPGGAAAQILLPENNPDQPMIRVVNAKSGAELFYRGKRTPQSKPFEKTLGAGESATAEFYFLGIAKFHAAGDYEISVICDYDGGAKKAESNSVKIKVARTTVRGLTLVRADNQVFFGTWVNLVPDKPRLLFMEIDFTPNGGVRQLADLAPGTLHTNAVLSVSANRAVAPGHWAGWIEDKKFHCLHYDPDQGPTSVMTNDLPGDRHELISPLFSENQADPGGRPRGAAIFCLGLRDQRNAQIQLLNLSKGAVEAGQRIAVTGEFPEGFSSHVSSKNVKRIYFYQKQEEKIALMQCAWPGYSDPPGPPRKLAEWDGVYVVSTSMMTYDDTVKGVIFFVSGKEASRKLQYAYWSLPAEKPLTIIATGEVPYEMDAGISAAKARLNQSGHFGAIFRTKNGQWSYFDKKVKLVELPLPWGITPLPMDLAFHRQDEPVLICAVENCGLAFIGIDGSEYKFDRNI